MNTAKQIKNNHIPRPTHFFILKESKFPFNFHIFEDNSLYFQKNRENLFPKKEINILGEDEHFIEIKNDHINLLISFINGENITLTEENVPSLYYLSKKYEIQSLIDETEQYIQENNLSLQFLLFYQNKSGYSLDNFIDQLSNHFLDYIHNEAIFNLKFPILYMTIEKVRNKLSPSELTTNEFIDFLFLCLDKYQRNASILFQKVDFDKLPMMYFQRLLSYDKSKFDSLFINNQMLKSIYDSQIDISKKEEEIKLKEKKIDEKMTQFETLILSLQAKITQLENDIQLKDQRYQQNIDSLTEKLKNVIIYKESVFLYNPSLNNAFNGIIHHLTTICGGNVDEKGVVKVSMPSINANMLAKYAVNLDNNKNYAQSTNVQNSFLKYDFVYRKVRPTHYSIRSRHDGGCNHLLHWVIEGSNTGSDNDWAILDQRSNITSLIGDNFFHTFEITAKLAKDTSYRYLRLRQTGPNSTNQYYLTLSALEYFGSLFEI